jgi:hypothetical protein
MAGLFEGLNVNFHDFSTQRSAAVGWSQRTGFG